MTCSTNSPLVNQMQTNNGTMMDRFTIRIPTLLQGIRCYTDASTTPDHASLGPTKAGIGVFNINTQVQPTQCIYIKAQMSASTSVIMAEAAALALAAMINQKLNFANTYIYILIAGGMAAF